MKNQYKFYKKCAKIVLNRKESDMGLFDRKKPDYLVDVEPVKVKETSDMHQTFNDYVDAYYKRYCKGKFLQKVFKEAHKGVDEYTDGELATSLRNGWDYEMLTVYLLKRVLVKNLDGIKGKEARKEAYEFNKVLMSRSIDIRLATKSEAKREDAEMKQRLGIE